MLLFACWIRRNSRGPARLKTWGARFARRNCLKGWCSLCGPSRDAKPVSSCCNRDNDDTCISATHSCLPTQIQDGRLQSVQLEIAHSCERQHLATWYRSEKAYVATLSQRACCEVAARRRGCRETTGSSVHNAGASEAGLRTRLETPRRRLLRVPAGLMRRPAPQPQPANSL